MVRSISASDGIFLILVSALTKALSRMSPDISKPLVLMASTCFFLPIRVTSFFLESSAP